MYNPDPNLRCYECDKWVRGRAALIKHKEECHGEKDQWYRCPYCSYVGKSVIAVMVGHIQHAHNSKFAQTTPISIMKVPKQGRERSRERGRTASPKERKERLSRSPLVKVDRKKEDKPKYSWSPTPKQPVFKKREEVCTRQELPKSPALKALSDDLGDGPSFDILDPSPVCFPSPPAVSRSQRQVLPSCTVSKAPEVIEEYDPEKPAVVSCLEKDLFLSPGSSTSAVEKAEEPEAATEVNQELNTDGSQVLTLTVD